VNYEQEMQEIKMLRKIYKFITEYGKFQLEYEGKLMTQGDQVQMYPSGTTLLVDQLIPWSPDESEVYRILMETLPWSKGGYFVLGIDRNRGIIYGYKPLEEK